MVRRLNQDDSGFADAFEVLLAMKREVSQDVNDVVAKIIADVRARGDDALIDCTAKFDRLDLRKTGIAVTGDEIEAAISAVDTKTLDALKLAHERIRSHHEKQKPADEFYEDALGVGLGSRWTAIEAVGLYVPGGMASYPSSVLMNAVPAVVAGVDRIVMVVPCPDVNSIRLSWPPRRSPASRKSTASAAPRPLRPLPMARSPSHRSRKSSDRATPTSLRQSGRCSAPSA